MCRTHSRSALSERRLGMIVFKDINIFRENRPSDEQSLLDLIFSVFTGARIRGGTKGRRRPKHLAMTGICSGLFWAARRVRFGAWAAERRDKSAYSIKHASFNYCRPVAHAPNLT